MKTWTKRSLISATVIVLLVGAGFAYRQYSYPYGWSHCCDKGLGMQLREYADRHGGWFPRGEESPEASLSLLYRMDPNLAYWLRGKTIPESVVHTRLESGKLLTPETCGWHYVEGLRSDDDPELAILWDKAGLGHNGARLSDGGHWVVFTSGSREYIPGADWDRFITQQTQLQAAIKRKSPISD